MQTADDTPAKRPRGRPPGTTKVALELRAAGADMHTPIDQATSYLDPAPQAPQPRGGKRPGAGRPKGTTRAVLDARKPGSGGRRPGAGRKRKIIDAETPVQTAARHAQELRTMANRHHREITRLNQRLRTGAT